MGETRGKPRRSFGEQGKAGIYQRPHCVWPLVESTGRGSAVQAHCADRTAGRVLLQEAKAKLGLGLELLVGVD